MEENKENNKSSQGIFLSFLLIIVVFPVIVFGIIQISEYAMDEISTNQHNNSETYTSANTSRYADSADRELQSVLNKIAGTYELTENLGIYGFRTVYTVKINRDGTGMFVSDNGHIENYFSARLSGSNKIVFNGNYGGSVYLLSGPGIEDESAKKELTEIGTPKYVMTKIR